VGLASAFFLWALPDLIKSRKKVYLYKISLAFLCHFSAILLVPLVFLSNNKWRPSIYLSLPLFSLLLVVGVTDLKGALLFIVSFLPGFLSSKATGYIIGVDLLGRFAEVNIFSKISLSAWGFYLLYAWACSYLNKFSVHDNIYLKLFGVMLTIHYLFSPVPVLASRSFELLSVSFIYSLPLIAEKFRPSFVIKLVIISWCLLYLCLVSLKLLNFEVW